MTTETHHPTREDLAVRGVECMFQVRIKGMNFPRYRRCHRVATVVEDGKPLCYQHSSQGRADSSKKSAKARADRRSKWYINLTLDSKRR